MRKRILKERLCEINVYIYLFALRVENKKRKYAVKYIHQLFMCINLVIGKNQEREIYEKLFMCIHFVISQKSRNYSL